MQDKSAKGEACGLPKSNEEKGAGSYGENYEVERWKEAMQSRDENETVLLNSDSEETILLRDENTTLTLMEGESAGVGNGSRKSRELYQLAEGEMLDGRYIIADILGFGGFGITYSAWDTKLENKVAVKEYYPASLVNRIPGTRQVQVYAQKQQTEFEKGLQRFLWEARSMAQFSGEKNIVNVYNYFQENGTAYLVMEYLDGVSLKEYTMQNGGKLPYPRVMEYMKCVVEALKVLHKKNIIHRDISPDNIFICKDGSVKLIDFGAARFAAREDEEKTLSVILKPGFAPPEQYRSKGKQGPWTDIYALGATMYRTVTGIVPDESVNRKKLDELKEPREYVPGIPLYFNNILMKCLAVLPELRFQTVSELEKRLDAQKPVSSVKKELQRRKLKRTAIIAGILLILGSLGYGEVNYIKAQHEKETLVETTLTVWVAVPKEKGAKEMKTVFEKSSADFLADYPFITLQAQYVAEKEYGEKLADVLCTDRAPDMFDSRFLPENKNVMLADLSDAYAMLKNMGEGKYMLLPYGGADGKMPTGFELPLIYRNTLLQKEQNKDIQGNDREAFLNGRTDCYVGTFGDYREVQDRLAGVYGIGLIDNDRVCLEFLNVWSVRADCGVDKINAANRFLYYLMGEKAQDIWYVQNDNGFPLEKTALDTLNAVNAELDFLKDLRTKDYEAVTLDEAFLEEQYQELEKEK